MTGPAGPTTIADVLLRDPRIEALKREAVGCLRDRIIEVLRRDGGDGAIEKLRAIYAERLAALQGNGGLPAFDGNGELSPPKGGSNA